MSDKRKEVWIVILVIAFFDDVSAEVRFFLKVIVRAQREM
jgi:hypothetical protein